jgi:hypothetical protein
MNFKSKNVRFEILSSLPMNIAFLWSVTTYNLVDRWWSFRGACCLHRQDRWLPWWWRQQARLKWRYISTRPHGITPEKTLIFSMWILCGTAQWYVLFEEIKYKENAIKPMWRCSTYDLYIQSFSDLGQGIFLLLFSYWFTVLVYEFCHTDVCTFCICTNSMSLAIC